MAETKEIVLDEKLINFADLKRFGENTKKFYASASSLKLKANASEVYTRSEVDNKLAKAMGKVDLTGYAKTEDLEKALKNVSTIKGDKGDQGAAGKSAYETAKENGFVGTEEQWLESLKGAKGDAGKDAEDGKSAYEVAMANGFVGTEAQWLESLKGARGEKGESGKDAKDGKSAYEIAVDNGFKGSEAEWLNSLKGLRGEKGESGKDAQDGKSAYDIAVENGFIGNEKQWLESLVGARGESGKDAQDGKDGKSAYEIAVANGFTGDETEWLASLKGEGLNPESYYSKAEVDQKIADAAAGEEVDLSGYAKAADLNSKANKDDVYSVAAADAKFATVEDVEAKLAEVSTIKGDKGDRGESGLDGKSAYEIAVANGFTGTEAQWLESLKGEKGADADPIDTSKFAQKSDLEGLAKTSDIPSLEGYAKTADIPDVSSFAKAEDIPDLTGYAKTSDLSGYAKATDIPDMTGYAKASDIPDVSNFAAKEDIPDLSGYAKTSDIPKQKTLSELGGVTQAGVEAIIQAKDFTSADVVRQMIADAIAEALKNNTGGGDTPTPTPEPDPTPSEPVEQPDDSDWAWTKYIVIPDAAVTKGSATWSTDMDTFFDYKFNHPDDFVGVGEDMKNTTVEFRHLGSLRSTTFPLTKATVMDTLDGVTFGHDYRKTWKDGMRCPIDGFIDDTEYTAELEKLNTAHYGHIDYDGEAVIGTTGMSAGAGAIFMIRKIKDGKVIPEYSIGEKIA